MLVLSRGISEAVYIGLGGVVRVLGVDRKSGRVKLGFSFPDGVSIVREEILEKEWNRAIQEEAS
jgi:carbon storage regulator CsrA